MSLGDPPKYCDFWYSARCNQLANAEVGLEGWWILSCMSGLRGIDNGLACDLMKH